MIRSRDGQTAWHGCPGSAQSPWPEGGARGHVPGESALLRSRCGCAVCPAAIGGPGFTRRADWWQRQRWRRAISQAVRVASLNPAPGAPSTGTPWPLGACGVCAAACDSHQPRVALEHLEGGRYERRPDFVILSNLRLYV